MDLPANSEALRHSLAAIEPPAQKKNANARKALEQ